MIQRNRSFDYLSWPLSLQMAEIENVQVDLGQNIKRSEQLVSIHLLYSKNPEGERPSHGSKQYLTVCGHTATSLSPLFSLETVLTHIERAKLFASVKRLSDYF